MSPLCRGYAAPPLPVGEASALSDRVLLHVVRLTGVVQRGVTGDLPGADELERIAHLADADKETGSYTIATFAGGLSGDVPAIANAEDLPEGWSLKMGATTLRVRYARGTIVSFR